MTGLDPAIHVYPHHEELDARNKAGHDEQTIVATTRGAHYQTDVSE